MKKIESYQRPNIDLIEVYSEGVLCGSPLEDLDENPGFWASTEGAVEPATVEII